MAESRKPEWLKIRLETGKNYPLVKETVEKHHLHTICSSGKCPNMSHCWNLGTATFMIMGDICTRSCKFCATKTGKPLPLDLTEPVNIAKSIALMKLKHCVITSVDRDDLPDKGAGHWAETVSRIKELCPGVVVEVLIPDYEEEFLDIVLASAPDIVGHNLETIERITPSVRSKATFTHSLRVLENIAAKGYIAKTGIMVGLGETPGEVVKLMEECRSAGCSMITIGQYLQPTKNNMAVHEYVTPELFEYYKEVGKKLGFSNVESAPLVRSSYMAEQSFINSLQKRPVG